MTDGPEATRLPEPGDPVWVDFRPTLGREQSGVRPALVLTSRGFHERSATAIACAITRNVEPWPTKVVLPAGLAITGAVLTDQIRNIDRAARGFRWIGRVPPETLEAVRGKAANLLGIAPTFRRRPYRPMTTRTLYYAPGACSLAAHIVLEESGLPFEGHRLDLAAGDQRKAEYLAINERGRVPALVEEGWVLTECAAIMRHVARSVPETGMWPTDPREQAVADEWLGWLAVNHHVAYAHVRRPERYTADETAFPGIRAKAADTYGDLCTMTEVRLSNGGWAVGGRFGVVDAYLVVFWVWGRGPALRFDMAGRFPAWTDHARTMAERPAVRRVFEREGLDLPR